MERGVTHLHWKGEIEGDANDHIANVWLLLSRSNELDVFAGWSVTQLAGSLLCILDITVQPESV
jgi:hypothetical protein